MHIYQGYTIAECFGLLYYNKMCGKTTVRLYRLKFDELKQGV